MEGLTISTHFQQFKDLKFQSFPGLPNILLSSALARPITRKFIIWSQFLSYAPPLREKSWLLACILIFDGWFFFDKTFLTVVRAILWFLFSVWERRFLVCQDKF